MKNRFLCTALAFATLTACRAPLHLTQIQPAQNVPVAQHLPTDEAVHSAILPYKDRVDAEMNTKISYTAVDLNKTGENSNLGNLLADYTFDSADEWARKNGIPQGVDAAVINIGGIRTSIAAGDILTKNIFEVMPFENEVVIVKFKGSELKGLFEYYVRTQVNNPVSRLYIESENGMSVKELINGKEVDPAATYYIATSDYLALGGDYMSFFSSGEMISTGLKLRDVFLERFRATTAVTPPTDVRLKFNGKKTQK